MDLARDAAADKEATTDEGVTGERPRTGGPELDEVEEEMILQSAVDTLLREIPGVCVCVCVNVSECVCVCSSLCVVATRHCPCARIHI